MTTEKKEPYVQPVLVKHELLRDITATKSGGGNSGGDRHTNQREFHHTSHRRGGFFGFVGRVF
jgi:hypothetical protein